MLSKLPKEIENVIRENLNVSEELDWDTRKRFYKLDPKLEPSLADMVKYNYFNYLRDTKEKFYPELIYLANNERMLNLLLNNSEIREDIDDHIYGALYYCIVNDNLEVFKILYSREKYISIYRAIRYNSINILKYIILDFPIIDTINAFHQNIIFLSKESISDLETYILSLGGDTLRLLPLSEIRNDNSLNHVYDMIDNNVAPSIVFSKIKEEGFLISNITSILKYLILTKNKYFFVLFDFLAEKEKDFLLHIISELYEIAVDTNDYILIKRILIDTHILGYVIASNYQYIERFISRSI